MRIEFEKICRTCMAESSLTLIPIWSPDKHTEKHTKSSLEPPSLALMLNTLTSLNVSKQIDSVNYGY